MEPFKSPLFARLTEAQLLRTEREARTTDDQLSDDLLYGIGNEVSDAGAPEMTPAYIRSRRFGRCLLGGLKPEEVRGFLDEVADALYSAQTLKFENRIRVKSLEADVEAPTVTQASVTPSNAFQHAQPQATAISRQEEHKDTAAASRLNVLRSTALQEVEALLHDAQVRAQAVTDAARERAVTILRQADALKELRQKEAEELIAGATATAESILTTARDQEATLRGEIDRLAESRLRMFDDVRATLIACDEWLATVDPRLRAAGVEGGRHVLSESVTNGGLKTD
jgi:DivIVA domain-containing protein